jgi:hypothetical protein
MKRIFNSSSARYFIPNIGTLILLALMLFVYRASAAPNGPAAPDATLGTISYQGMLNDAAGQPINGSTNITFRLYSVPTGGTALWTEAHTSANAVPVSNGLFNVLLGSLDPIPASVWSNANVYLGVQVGGDAEMSPRETVSVVPTAMTVPEGAIGTAQIASGAITTAKIMDGAVTSSKLNVANGLTMIGNLNVNGQLDSSTNVMLRFATSTTDGEGQAAISPYLAVVKPAHYWMGCEGGQSYWNAYYDFIYNPTVGQLSNLPQNCKVVIYYISSPGGQGNPAHSPPDW